MKKKIRSLAMVLTLAAAALPAHAADSKDEAQNVRVTNFPATQEVKGSVAVPDPIPAAILQSFATTTVPPVEPSDVAHLVNLGTLKTAGFTEAVLSLRGTLKGSPAKLGTVGVMLVPDEPAVIQVLEEDGIAEFPLRAEVADVGKSGTHFASLPARSLVAFPSYRVYAYNSTDKTVAVALYAYLTQ